MIIVIKNVHGWALLCIILDTLSYESCSISPTSSGITVLRTPVSLT